MGRTLRGAAALAALGLLCGSAGAEDRKILAVFDLELSGLELSKKKLGTLDDYLHRKLASGRRFAVVPRAEVRKRLRQAKAESYKACYDQSCQIEVGKELAAEQTVSAKILKVGDECLVSLLVYDLRTAASAGASEATGGCGLSGLIRSVESAALALEGPAPAAAAPAAPKRFGVVDAERCPEADTRRMGAAPPEGRAYWCVDAKNRRQGPQVTFHTNGEVALRESYVEGLAQGVRTTFHDNGQPSERGKMKDNLRVGTWARWSRQGVKIEEGPYEAGSKAGEWTRFHGRHGYVMEVAAYAKGRKAGAAVEKREDGSVRARGDYADGERTGTWRFFSDGRLTSTLEYRAGARHGLEISYDDKGAPRSERTYEADRKSGPARSWSRKDGRRYLSQVTAYLAGKEHGVRKAYAPTGALRSQVAYRAGKKHGRTVQYRETRDGERYMSSEGSYLQGKKDGRWRSWAAPERLSQETTYAKGKKTGPYVRYRSGTGDKSESGTYLDGRRDGWVTYFRDGRVTKKARYARGRKVEETRVDAPAPPTASAPSASQDEPQLRMIGTLGKTGALGTSGGGGTGSGTLSGSAPTASGLPNRLTMVVREVEGSLDLGSVSRTLAFGQDALLGCLRKEALSRPVRVELRLRKTGRVARARVAHGIPKRVRYCLSKALRKVRFEEGQGKTKVALELSVSAGR